MIKLDAVFEFGLSEMILDHELMGTRLNLLDSTAWIQFPDADQLDGGQLFRSSQPITGYNTVDSEVVAYQVNAVIVGVPIEADLDLSRPDHDEVQRILRQTSPVATDLISQFVDWLRSDRERVVLRSGNSQSSVNPIAAGLVSPGGVRLDFGHLYLGAVSIKYSTDALTLHQAKSILASISNRDNPPLSDLFLADALSMSDLNHSVVLAAIACEIAVKTALTNNAKQDQQLLVELLLQRPRDYSMAAASLFDEPCRAVLGKSLRSDNHDLFKQISRLFEDRNRIVHKALAELRDSKSLTDEVQAAGKAIDWLDSTIRGTRT